MGGIESRSGKLSFKNQNVNGWAMSPYISYKYILSYFYK